MGNHQRTVQTKTWWRAVIALVVGCMVGSLALAQSTTINVLAIQDPFFYALQKVIPQFEKETGIKVNLQGLDYNTLHARAVNSFLTKQPGVDVLSVDQMWISQWADNGWLEQLDPNIKQDNSQVNIEDFIPNVLYTLSEWKGHLYSLPVAAYGQDVIYRPDVFKALGLPMPPASATNDPNWTWDQYLKDIQAINGKTVSGTKMYGTVVAGAAPEPVVHMFTGLASTLGQTWFKQFPGATPWDFTPQMDSKTNVKALNLFLKLYKNSPSASVNYVWFDAGTAFSKGNIGMFYWWTPYNYLVDKAGYMAKESSAVAGKYAIAPMPHDAANNGVTSLGGYSLGIDAYSAHKAAAWKFVKWATSAATQKEMALLPDHQFDDFARASLYNNASATLKSAYPWLGLQYQVLANNANGKVSRPPIPIYFTLEGLYGQTLNQVLAGQMTPEAALKSVQSTFKVILDNNQYIPWKQASYADTIQNTKTLMATLAGK